MPTIRAICENGVFRPLDPIDLSDGSEVELEVKPNFTGRNLDPIYEIMDRRYDSGEHDVAARHNEHQP